MKIRQGFVSNSSSSSFIVMFQTEPKSKEELQKILFGDGKLYPNPYDEGGYPTDMVAETVWKDIQEQKKNDYSAALNAVKGGWFDGKPDYEDFKKPSSGGNALSNFDWEAYEKASDIGAKKLLDNFLNTRKLKLQHLNNVDSDNKPFYVFTYADEDGSYGSALEHGTLFDNVKSLRISYH